MLSTVLTTPYSIGYSPLGEAARLNLPFAQMINKAGRLVSCSPASVLSSVIELGTTFDQYYQASLADPIGQKAWPMAGECFSSFSFRLFSSSLFAFAPFLMLIFFLLTCLLRFTFCFFLFLLSFLSFLIQVIPIYYFVVLSC
jgi:hypothetical protein